MSHIINFISNPSIPRKPKNIQKRKIVNSNKEYTEKLLRQLIKDLNNFGFKCTENNFGKAGSSRMVFLYKNLDELTKEYLKELEYIESITMT